MSSSVVYQTAVGSLVAQVIIGIVTGASFVLQIKNTSAREELNVILGLELGSQVVEFLWYSIVICRFRVISTWTRYIDWVISTPIMLCSTVLFFSHRDDSVTFASPFESIPIYMCLLCNWIMLLFGFLAETGRIPKPIGLTLGSLGFVGSFTLLGTHVHDSDGLSIGLFWFTYAVWSLYGVAAMLPYQSKNISYNVLDIVSKNFYGLFLFGYTLTLL